MMEQHRTVWSTSKKVAFRFLFIFFTLFIIISNNGVYPFWEVLFQYPTELLHQAIPWVGKHVLQLSYEITVFTNGSGDTTYNYVLLFCIVVIAGMGTIIWSVLDLRRSNYETLYYWLTVAIRFYVGLMLIHYGLIKIIKVQFPYPGFYRLAQNYGDSSPMGLAWTFLGFSKGYNIFMGMAELAAILLLFRRTLTFGALITFMTTLNVMAVNYFYDVPVKIISSILVAMTLFLLLRDIEPLIKFFFTGKSISLPVIKAPVFNEKWKRVSKIAFKSLIIGLTLFIGTRNALEAEKRYGEKAPKPALYGLYNVDTFVMNTDTIPPLMTDSLRWKQFTIEWKGVASIDHMANNSSSVTTTVDTVSHKLELTMRNDSTKTYSMVYEIPAPDKFYLKGTYLNDSLSILMTRKKMEDFLLINRGFHWINEYPFGR